MKCTKCEKEFNGSMNFMEDLEHYQVLELLDLLPGTMCGECGNDLFYKIKKFAHKKIGNRK